MKKVIEVKGIEKEYGTKTKFLALKGIDLEVNEGDFLVIMGPSGSGKTTFLNMISTIDNPTKGKVYINGKSIASMGETEIARFRYENMGFIFQEFNLIDTITISQNISIPLSLSKLNSKEMQERVQAIAKKLDIEELLDKYPSECSGGQRQRVAVARALINNPTIIVADEPTGNLDTKNSHDLLKLLKELNDKENITIVMVTHDSMIASYSKRLVFIRDGLIDTVIEREGKSQKEFFYKIVDITSKESQNLFLEFKN